MGIYIGQDTYDIISEWLENISAKYFDIPLTVTQTSNGKQVTATNPELSLLKTGFFGFTNEVMAQSVKNASFHRNLLFKELSLNTASVPENIYNFAKLYNYDIPMATPADMKIRITIEKGSLIKNSTYDDSLKKYVLNLTTADNFIADSYIYRLKKDIIIYSTNKYDTFNGIDISEDIKKIQTNYNNNFTHEVYDTNNGELSDPHVVLDVDNYITFEMNLEQTEYTEKTVVVDNKLAGKPIEIVTTTANDISSFKVYYKQSSTFKEIPVYFNNYFTPSGVTEYAYYSFQNSKTLVVSFPSTLDEFKPQIMSEIKVKAYHTKAAECNFLFNGKINFSSATGMKLDTIITSNTDSLGGVGALTLKEIKNNIMNIILERNNLITESDLQKYFNKEITKKFSYSTSKFIRKQDDILSRIFDSYILMKNKNALIIPTNTLDISYEETTAEYFGGRNIRINPATDFVTEDFEYAVGTDNMIQHMTLKNEYILTAPEIARDRMYPEYSVLEILKDKSSYNFPNISSLDNLYNVAISPYEKSPAYRIPFLIDIVFKLNSVTRNIDEIVTMKNTHLNITSGMVLRKVNPALGLNVNVTNCTLKREFLDNTLITEDDLNVSKSNIIYFTTFLNLNALSNSEKELLDVKLVLRDGAKVYAYAPLTANPDSVGTFECQFLTADEYDVNGKLKLYNIKVPDDQISTSVYIPKDIIFEVVIGLPNSSKTLNNIDILPGINFSNLFNISDSSSYVTACSFIPTTTAEGYISLYKDMSNVCPLGIIHYEDYIESGIVAKLTSTPQNRVDIVTFYKDGVVDTSIDTGEIIRLNGTDVCVIYNDNNTYNLFSTDYTLSKGVIDFTDYPSGISVTRKNKVKKVKITGVPVVGYSYLNPEALDIDNYSLFYDTFNSYVDLLTENFEKLENNTSFNLKLFNTYGRSKFFNTKNIHLKMNIQIKLKVSYSSNIDFNIKLFIMRYIEGVNAKAIFPMSNLQTALENKFTEIDYIIFDDDENYFGYYIKNYNTQSNLLLDSGEDYVPEYLNVELESNDFSTTVNTAVLTSGIKITYL